MEPYTYEPLPLTEDSNDTYIRLLLLPRGPKTGPIKCSIFQTPLSTAPEFGALSYCWGDTMAQSTIYVASEAGDDRTLLVPASLIPFLYRTRSFDWDDDSEMRVWWIDSICINQQDEIEKNVQVSRMRDIYIKASITHIWLGEEADGSTQALEYAWNLQKRHFAKAEQGKNQQDQDSKIANVKVRVGEARLEALLKVWERPWFQRGWIVQEVVVSRNPWVVCGESSQSWMILVYAWVYLMSNHIWLWNVYPAHRKWAFLALGISQREWKDENEPQWWRLLARHRGCATGDPRDKIFGLWGLGCRGQFERLGIRPQYMKSVEGLYIELAVAALKARHMELFSVPRLVCGDTVRPLNIPTWVPDWRWTQNTPWTLCQWEGANIKWIPPWNTSKNSVFEPAFKTASGKDGMPTALRLEGFAVAQIVKLTSRPWKQQDPSGKPSLKEEARILQRNQAQAHDWEAVLLQEKSALSVYVPTGESHAMAANTTIFGGILLNGDDEGMRQVMTYYEKRQWILRQLFTLGLNQFLWMYIIVILIERVLGILGYFSPDAFFSTHAASSMTNRKGARLDKVGDREYMCMVPGISRLGDWIVVCRGVKVPLVLRRKSDEKDGNWEFVGDCYVHGIMKGEFWQEKQAGGSEYEEFWLE